VLDDERALRIREELLDALGGGDGSASNRPRDLMINLRVPAVPLWVESRTSRDAAIGPEAEPRGLINARCLPA
jgi:hypothetical protein